jgi:hypothetical protein
MLALPVRVLQIASLAIAFLQNANDLRPKLPSPAKIVGGTVQANKGIA